MPEKLDENEGRWCAVGGERPWPSAERSGGRQVTDDDEPAKLIFYFEIAWRERNPLDRGRALGRLADGGYKKRMEPLPCWSAQRRKFLEGGGCRLGSFTRSGSTRAGEMKTKMGGRRRRWARPRLEVPGVAV
jgi:hypothetical protein